MSHIPTLWRDATEQRRATFRQLWPQLARALDDVSGIGDSKVVAPRVCHLQHGREGICGRPAVCRTPSKYGATVCRQYADTLPADERFPL